MRFTLSPLRAVAAALVLGLAGQVPIGGPVRADEGFATLSSTQLATMLQSKAFFFVNVHIPYEGEIEGTDANIAFDTIAEHLAALPTDKAAPIVLYCRSGRMSETAAKELSRLGYTNVSHLGGGMVDWQKNGRHIVVK